MTSPEHRCPKQNQAWQKDLLPELQHKKKKCTSWEGLSRRDIETVAKLAGTELEKVKLSWS